MKYLSVFNILLLGTLGNGHLAWAAHSQQQTAAVGENLIVAAAVAPAVAELQTTGAEEKKSTPESIANLRLVQEKIVHLAAMLTYVNRALLADDAFSRFEIVTGAYGYAGMPIQSLAGEAARLAMGSDPTFDFESALGLPVLRLELMGTRDLTEEWETKVHALLQEYASGNHDHQAKQLARGAWEYVLQRHGPLLFLVSEKFNSRYAEICQVSRTEIIASVRVLLDDAGIAKYLDQSCDIFRTYYALSLGEIVELLADGMLKQDFARFLERCELKAEIDRMMRTQFFLQVRDIMAEHQFPDPLTTQVLLPYLQTPYLQVRRDFLASFVAAE